jgi:acetyltransferase-like isoleucine patch superfamily enzyme
MPGDSRRDAHKYLYVCSGNKEKGRSKRMGFEIGEDCQIHPTAVIDVEEGSLGPRSIIREGARIEGRYVVLGTETYMDYRARIGGGSCYDFMGHLTAGDWLHMGVDSHINIARAVSIGDEVGIGVETKIWTHGAYLPIDEGFPMQWAPVDIGDRVWLPNAWVNPGVFIGKYAVIAAGSVVNQHIPMGSFAGGVPAKILKKDVYPKKMERKDLDDMFEMMMLYCRRNCKCGLKHVYEITQLGDYLIDSSTYFNIEKRRVVGPVTKFTEIVKNQLRRYGIRFKFYPKDGEYVSW